jgi:FPC/CPF motif-containing protein YcgG
MSLDQTDSLLAKIEKFITIDYPCIPAILALKNGSIITKYFNSEFGKAEENISQYLDELIARYEAQKEPFLSLWLSWEIGAYSEEEYEDRMWAEINSFCQDIPVKYKNEQLFIVGLHSNASRKARKFEHCSLVINLFSQFERLEKSDSYHNLVQNIRNRDINFSGSVNPTVEKFADIWEEVQFSGKENDLSWKVPNKKF